ncbi:MAG: transketolase C-terminal domain-containing protein [Spirochaetia bacterium]|jgi:transketolase
MTIDAPAQDLRDAVVAELVAAAEKGIPVVVLVSDSTSSSSIGPFAARFPERLVNVGIAEQNMLGVAAGLSLGGYVSVTANAACFLTARSCEQLKTDICYSATNVKLLGLSAGVAYGPLAATHHAINDVSIMRGMGNILIFAPADGVEAAQALRYALAYEGPVYLRLDNARLPLIHGTGYRFVPGRVDVAAEGTDVTLFSLGTMAAEALAARDLLSRAGVSAGVASLSSVRPVDRETIVRLACATGRVVTVEEHSVQGGIGSLVCESLGDAGRGVRLLRLGIPEGEFAKAGPRAQIRKYYGIDAAGIAAAALRVLGRGT